MNRAHLIVLGLVGITITVYLAGDANASPAIPATTLAELSTWSPALEQGGAIRYRRIPCDAERTAIETRTGAPAPDVIDVGVLETFGPLPERIAQGLVIMLRSSGAQQIAAAESAKVEDVASARLQASDLLDGQKALVAAGLLADGHYWTVRANSHPKLPAAWSYYAMTTNETTPDGARIDVFVPIDLTQPELRVPYEAVLSLENELRRERAAAFNRLGYEERREIIARAERERLGEKDTPSQPEGCWRLDVDPNTCLATARLRDELVPPPR